MTAQTRLVCDRNARHAFWEARYKHWRRELVAYATFTLVLALAFLIATWAGLRGIERVSPPPPVAKWNAAAERWECPAPLFVTTDEDTVDRDEAPSCSE